MNTAIAAVDSTRAVQEDHQQPPQRDEVEAPLGLVVVRRTGPVAAAAAGAAVAPGFDQYLDVRHRRRTVAPPNPPAPPDSPAQTGRVADGEACLAAADCASGVCEGQGCDDRTPGQCAPAARGCTRDLRPYCGCDGVTFRTSGSCPGQRFAERAECPGA